MKISLEVIDRLFDYLTPEVVNDPFEQKKLSLKLRLIAKLHPSVKMSVEYIIDNMQSLVFSTDNSLSAESSLDLDFQQKQKLQQQIDLTQYYSLLEIQEINKAFGFKPGNKYITYSQIHVGYMQNSHIPKAKEYYYQLLWAHFKANDIYDSPQINQITNTIDELIYARETQS